MTNKYIEEEATHLATIKAECVARAKARAARDAEWKRIAEAYGTFEGITNDK